MVGKVTESLERTTVLASDVVSMMESVAEAVENQTTAIAQVTEGIDQISAVVQTNSATSEECAAASEQLSSQANIMHQLMAEFRISNRAGFGGGSSSFGSAGSSFSGGDSGWGGAAPADEEPIVLSSGRSSDNPFTDRKSVV